MAWGRALDEAKWYHSTGGDHDYYKSCIRDVIYAHRAAKVSVSRLQASIELLRPQEQIALRRRWGLGCDKQTAKEASIACGRSASWLGKVYEQGWLALCEVLHIRGRELHFALGHHKNSEAQDWRPLPNCIHIATFWNALKQLKNGRCCRRAAWAASAHVFCDGETVFFSNNGERKEWTAASVDFFADDWLEIIQAKPGLA